MSNNRTYFATQAVGIAKDGTTTFQRLFGVQSVGVTVNFNLNDVLQLGQLEVYESIEDMPVVECTIDRVLDGNALCYHLATRGFTSNTIAGRSVPKCTVAVSTFDDDQSSASGTPLTEVQMSGLYVNSIRYSIPLQGQATESVTFGGNNITYKTSSFNFTGGFNNNDEPLALTSGTGGVQQRENVIMGDCLFPHGDTGIPGISSSGTNNKTNGAFGAHIGDINISCDFNRQDILEQGRRAPYHRFIQFPVSVQTEISVTATDGLRVQATEAGSASGNNLVNQTIKVKLEDSTLFDLGTRNKLVNVNQTGGDTGGSNVTFQYQYRNNSSYLVITNDNMPA